MRPTRARVSSKDISAQIQSARYGYASKGTKAFSPLKGKSSESGTTRIEVEEEITIEKAEILLKLCLPGIIDKTRYEIVSGKHTWEIDEFYGENEGLIIVEIELASEDEYFKKPNWLGLEVTGDHKYYNSQLSLYPFSTWEVKD